MEAMMQQCAEGGGSLDRAFGGADGTFSDCVWVWGMKQLKPSGLIYPRRDTALLFSIRCSKRLRLSADSGCRVNQ